MSTAICWFKNDLRLTDNPALRAAASAEALICVYCVDSRHEAVSMYGPAKFGPHRRAFRRQALADLRERCAARGAPLFVLAAEPEHALAALAERYHAGVVHTSTEFAPEEAAQIRRVRAALPAGALVEHDSSGLYTTDDMPFALADVPRTFTRFRKQVEDHAVVGRPLAAPDALPGPPAGSDDEADAMPGAQDWPATATPYPGGESAALARLQHYLWDTGAIKAYKQTRNGLLGLDFSSKFSPWLAAGCLSPRTVAAEIERFESHVTANKSTYWLLFELRWREFFRWVLDAERDRLFHLGGILDRDDRFTDRDAVLIAAWQDGRTGMPFIDANMRELAATGYMSNRGRQNAASFFVRDMGQDWRVGAAWFEYQLVDYDVSSNWGNWATVAGVGTDKRDNGFNVLAQARRYDKHAEYVSHWLPELRGLPADQRQTAFHLSRGQRDKCGYPELAIDVPDYWQ